MAKKAPAAPAFEQALSELEQIVVRLESGDLPLEEALSEFERGIRLARQDSRPYSRQNSALKSCSATIRMPRYRLSMQNKSKPWRLLSNR